MFISATGMRPLIYGYMRVTDDTSDELLDAAEEQMRLFAAAEGYCYVITFFDHQRGSFAEFTEMLNELNRAGSRHVVVPCLGHLSAHRILRGHLVAQLAAKAGAYVHEANTHHELRDRDLPPFARIAGSHNGDPSTQLEGILGQEPTRDADRLP